MLNVSKKKKKEKNINYDIEEFRSDVDFGDWNGFPGWKSNAEERNCFIQAQPGDGFRI